MCGKIGYCSSLLACHGLRCLLSAYVDTGEPTRRGLASRNITTKIGIGVTSTTRLRPMATVPSNFEERMADVLLRVERLEHAQVQSAASAPWQYLVERCHPWRRQLSIKGRNMTAAQLVGTMRANHLSPEQAAADFELPLDAIHEAQRYCSEHADLIALEANEERRRLIEKGYRLESANLPR